MMALFRSIKETFLTTNQPISPTTKYSNVYLTLFILKSKGCHAYPVIFQYSTDFLFLCQFYGVILIQIYHHMLFWHFRFAAYSKNIDDGKTFIISNVADRFLITLKT